MARTSGSLTRDVVFFITLMATAIALSGALAHAFELANKMILSREEYFIVQTIYSGWNRFAFVLLVELLGTISLLYLYWRDPAVFRPVLTALTFLVMSQVIFWVWTFPANSATDQWTTQPENWEQLRHEWEYSHLAGAVFQLLVMASLVIALIKKGKVP